MKKYDLIVIGSGPAGSTAAHLCVKKGLKVAVADELFGGTCALRGCTPKKAMESVSSLYWEASNLSGHGFSSPSPVNWENLLSHKQSFTALVPANTKKDFREAGIELIESKVSFSGKNKLTDGSTTYKANNIVIATGAIPRPLDFPGFSHLVTTEDFFELPQMPKRLVFAGGGYVGFELAHIAAACGSEVTIVSDEQKPLGAFDPDLVTQFVLSTLEKGIDVRLGFSVNKIVKKGEKYKVHISRPKRKNGLVIETDCVIHSAGRIPNIAHLDLKKAGVSFSEKGIETNDRLQCKGNSSIYAIGDVNGRFPFTPIGEYESQIAAYNLLHKQKKKANYQPIPTVLFSYPKLASIGKSERDLIKEGIKFEVRQKDAGGFLMEKAVHNAYAGYKVLIGKKDGSVLGAHLLGSKADEIINLFALIMQNDIPANKIKTSSFAFPTISYWLPSMVG